MEYILVAFLLGIVVGNFWVGRKIIILTRRIEKRCVLISRTNEILKRQVRALQSKEHHDG